MHKYLSTLIIAKLIIDHTPQKMSKDIQKMYKAPSLLLGQPVNMKETQKGMLIQATIRSETHRFTMK